MTNLWQEQNQLIIQAVDSWKGRFWEAKAVSLSVCRRSVLYLYTNLFAAQDIHWLKETTISDKQRPFNLVVFNHASVS